MLPEREFNDMLRGILNGTISTFELPLSLYTYTCKQLSGSLLVGFNIGSQSRIFGSVAEGEKAYLYRQNIGRFSGAKTWQEVNALTSMAFDKNGVKRSFKAFKEVAHEINEKYNKNWLAVEQDAVISQAQSARRWLKIQEELDIFPILEYQTVNDARVRDDHQALDGLILEATDSMWDSIMPPNGWNCRCIVVQHTEDVAVTPHDEARAQAAEQMAYFKAHPEFDCNAGKVDFVFKESGKGKHDYFKVPREFSEDLKNNFGLPPIEDVV